MSFEIAYYHDYISEELATYLLNEALPVTGVSNLLEVGRGGGLETTEALVFLCELYQELEPALKKVLSQRIIDRKFIDERVKACFGLNQSLHFDFLDPEYKTIIGLEDASGRIVIGPHSKEYCESLTNKPIAAIPEFLKGPHVTLFGPPGSAKMAINAMNTYHRKLKGEPEVVAKLLSTHASNPKWGADDEDSKTPLRSDLVNSAVNLTSCFEGTLAFTEAGKKYELASEHLSFPIKRFPGLALPCTFLFYKKNPIPLHLYDFALHLFKNWHNPKALVFYVPKLENEEEAAYIHKMISLAELKIKNLHPEYVLGTVRLMIVLENPRAILRTHEIMDALYPYFAGASLGWHDYLASTARVFKEDGNYRIPVKADPDIVIKYIKASHNLLSDVVGSRGGIKVGGMYGILPLDTDLKSESFQITIKGYIKDVVTQMKRNLTGFWVAHPDFVRLGLALVEAWKHHSAGQPELLTELVESLLEKKYHQEVLDFIKKPDIIGLDKNNPQYVRSLLVADIKESDYIANHDPEEIRYNVFQSLQYLTDWLCGNGCVALPAHVHGVAVRVMDDLATAERSRWEVWHEINYGRFKLEDFLKIAFEEYHFIRKDLSNEKKIVQVKWNEVTQKWYPVALRLMIQLMTAKKPVEFATELLMPFTVESVREAADPLKKINAVDSRKYHLEPYIERYLYYFEICGCSRFATEMAQGLAMNLAKAENIILNFSKTEIIEAASFHGNIGEDKKTLDALALSEQALVLKEGEAFKKNLQELGEKYLVNFGMKFLISAKGKSGQEMLEALKARLKNIDQQSEQQELSNAKQELWEISLKRFKEKPFNSLFERIESLRLKYQVNAVSLAINVAGRVQPLSFGEAHEQTQFELASLSKTLASAFSLEYFAKKNISIDTSVNTLLASTASKFRLKSDTVSLRHLMNHSALNMHYVKGYPLNEKMPKLQELLSSIEVIAEPGAEFHYSGGGFIVLEYLIEELEKKSIQDITKNFLDNMSFSQLNLPGKEYATGYFDDAQKVAGTRMMFPAFAAGAMGTASKMAQFLNQLTSAYHKLETSGNISHNTAVQMLFGTDKGCREFMGCDMGLGVFIAEAGNNKLAIHQGANEGFRCLYIHCFSGPDCGNGLVILCNADNKGVLFNAEAAQLILKELNISGIDFNKFNNDFDKKNISQENLVNTGYKNLIFDAFLPMLPEEIVNKGQSDPLAAYNLLTHATIKKVSNQKFARASNMISTHLPVFDPELFGKQGKIMDSWESARHNPVEFDFVELDLAESSPINYVSLSTEFHDGNQAQFVRILGFDNLKEVWTALLPKQKMTGHSFINIKLQASEKLYSRIKIEMYPDGGLTRVGLYDKLPENFQTKFTMTECERFKNAIPVTHKPLSLKYESSVAVIKRNQTHARINLAGLAFGAKILKATNEHYSPAIQLLSPFPAINMFDGLESARSRRPDNFEEVIIQLAIESKIKRIILDFEFFVNNNPSQISIEALSGVEWLPLVKKIDTKAYAGNKIEFIIDEQQDPKIKYTQLKIRTFPDGGINRLYVFAD
ncbi:MAG: serine hydrolase [Bdellovibrionota bacterium]